MSAAPEGPRVGSGAGSGSGSGSGGYRFPLERTNDRALPADYVGPIDVWDIDQTYLDTAFDGVLQLMGRALEAAVDKRTRPGAAALLRALRRGPGGSPHPRGRTPLFFVSASPPQLRGTLERKMLLDGVEPDGISFKDHLSLLTAGRFREVKRHIAYKLTALLEYRLEWPAGAREWLYGDDAESDPLIYSLYAEMRGGTLGMETLDLVLSGAKVQDEDRRRLASLVQETSRRAPPPVGGSVEGIYIFRAAKRPRHDLTQFPRVTPVTSAVDLARILAARGRIDEAGVLEVAREAEG